jgi:hypothetical protein
MCLIADYYSLGGKMVVERWTDEMLDRLASQTQGNADQQLVLSEQIKGLVRVANIQQDIMDKLSLDMRGLQLEVRRLIERMDRVEGEP